MSENLDEIKVKTIKGFFWRFAERISAQVVTFIVSIVLARILIPEDYGIIAIVNIFIMIADTLVTSGLGTSLIQKKDADQIDFSTIFFAGLFLSFIFYLILFFIAPFISKIYKSDLLTSVLRVMGLRLPISAINSVQQAFVSRKMVFKKFFFATIIGTFISAVIGIIMAIHGFGVWALVSQSMINPFIDTVVLFLTVGWIPSWKFSFKRLRTLFSFGWKLMFSNMIGVIFNKLRSLLIGAKYNPDDLAFYNRGETLPQLITQNISSSLDSVLFPALAKVQDDLTLIKKAAKKALRLQGYVIIPLMFGLSATANVIVPILLTEKWNAAIPFIQIICIQEIIELLGASSLQTIKSLGRSDTILILEFIKKPLYFVIILFASRVNVYVLAITGIINSFLAFFMNSFPLKKIINYGFWEQLFDLFPSIVMSLFMAIIVYFVGKIKLNLYFIFFLQITLGFFIYLLESWFFKNEEFLYIIEFIKKTKNKTN